MIKILPVLFAFIVLVYSSADILAVEPGRLIEKLNLDSTEYLNCADIYDVLEKSSYIKIQKNGYWGADKSIFIRGSSNTQVLAMIDGIKLESLNNGVSALATFALRNASVIEVYDNAINIITKKSSSAKPTTEFQYEYQKFNSMKYNLGFDVSNGNTAALFRADRMSTWGFRENENYLGESILANISLNLKNAGSFTFMGFSSMDDRGLPGQSPSSFAAAGDNARYEKQFGALGYRVNLDSITIITELFGSIDEEFRDISSSLTSNQFAQNIGRGIKAGVMLPVGFKASAEILQNRYFSEDYAADMLLAENSRTLSNFTASESLTAGKFKIFAAVTSVNQNSGAGYLCPKFEAESAVNEMFTAKASASKNIRFPSLEESSITGGLDSEKIYAYSAGIRLQKNFARFDLDFFSNDYKDVVEFGGNSDFIYRSRGIENSLKVKFNNVMENVFSYTYAATENRESLLEKPYSPKSKFTSKIEYTGLRDTSIIVALTAVGRQFSNYSNTQELPGYSVWDVVFSRKILASNIYAGINNFTDKDYVAVKGYPLPGRIYYAGIKINFTN